MIYRASNMTLAGIRSVKDTPACAIEICRNTDAPQGDYYTVITIEDHQLFHDFLDVYDRADPSTTRYIDCFSEGDRHTIVYPYAPERPLEEFYFGEALSLSESEDICINVIVSCMAARLPWPILYLILTQGQLHLARDGQVSLGYQIDLTELESDRDERDCAIECARLLKRLLESKAGQKAMSFILLKKKIAKRSYSGFAELYKDVRIAAVPKEQQGWRLKLRLWVARNRDTMFRLLLIVCLIMAIVAAALFITQAIFGDVPWLRLFISSFKRIGTESLLQ
ncbi:MAG: hypothetical protein II800_00160 [Lachnospiraceae bacterium]|nr:hypothetical protein [Lachnospiraceae bacterium]